MPFPPVSVHFPTFRNRWSVTVNSFAFFLGPGAPLLLRKNQILVLRATHTGRWAARQLLDQSPLEELINLNIALKRSHS
jgi:hypothetical protein